MAKLSNYKGSIGMTGGFTPKGGQTFPLMEAHDIMVAEDDTRLDEKLEDLGEKYEDLSEGLKNAVGERVPVGNGLYVGADYKVHCNYADAFSDTDGIVTADDKGTLDALAPFISKSYDEVSATNNYWLALDYTLKNKNGGLAVSDTVFGGLFTSLTAGILNDLISRYNSEAHGVEIFQVSDRSSTSAEIAGHYPFIIYVPVSNWRSVTECSAEIYPGGFAVLRKDCVYDENNHRIIVSGYTDVPNVEVKATVTYKYHLKQYIY